MNIMMKLVYQWGLIVLLSVNVNAIAAEPVVFSTDVSTEELLQAFIGEKENITRTRNANEHQQLTYSVISPVIFLPLYSKNQVIFV